jgi:hypothetical protein
MPSFVGLSASALYVRSEYYNASPPFENPLAWVRPKDSSCFAAAPYLFAPPELTRALSTATARMGAELMTNSGFKLKLKLHALHERPTIICHINRTNSKP